MDFGKLAPEYLATPHHIPLCFFILYIRRNTHKKATGIAMIAVIKTVG
jgi:hypothetical protein